MPDYWRVFPWDPTANPGSPFSASYVPHTTGRGRFDLLLERSAVLYCAESPEHAVAESLQPWRNRPLRPEHLLRAGRSLALARVRITGSTAPDLADLCDPHRLVQLDITPDAIASRYRFTTQPLARKVWDAGHVGLRWWSVFWGDWHGAVLFTERLGARLRFDDPQPLTMETEAVRVAAGALGMSA